MSYIGKWIIKTDLYFNLTKEKKKKRDEEKNISQTPENIWALKCYSLIHMSSQH